MAESEIQNIDVEYRSELFGHEVVLRFTLPLRVVDGKIEVAEREPSHSWEATPIKRLASEATPGAFVCVRDSTDSSATLAWVREQMEALEASTPEE